MNFEFHTFIPNLKKNSAFFASSNPTPSSPTFPMTSPFLINGGGRTYRLDVEIITKSSSLSSHSSTLSESSNSTSFFISTKRARSTRKRPNQSTAEAAALLSTISPKLFSPTVLQRASYFPVRFPSFSVPDEAALLFCEQASAEDLPIRLEPKMPDSSVCSMPYFQDPGSPEFDAESILGDEVEEGIDSIMGMGNLSMSSDCIKDGSLDCLGFSFGISSNIRRALRQKDKGEWWWADVVDVRDIIPKLKLSPVKTTTTTKKKKKKKKDEEEVEKDSTGGSSPEDGILELRLWLKLDYDDVIKEWSGGSPFSGEVVSLKSATDVIARLTSIDLFPDVGGGALKAASVQRYKEKQRTSFFNKKIGYQVRKVNGDQRPRMKGRFGRNPSLLQETMSEECH